MKTCTKCKQQLPLDNFRKYSGRSSDGLRPLCKACQRVYEQTWRSTSKESRRATRQKRAGKEKAYRQIYDAQNRGRLLIMEAKRRCSRKRVPFDLDQYITEVEQRIQAGVCELTGMPLNLHNSGVNWDSPSLDRIEPGLGYVYSNIRVVCFAMNAAMGRWGETVLKQIMTAWLAKG